MNDQIVFDLECNGLIDDITQIWCASFYHTGFKNMVSYTPKDISQLPEYLYGYIKSEAVFIAHNLIKYDREVIRKLLGIVIPIEQCQDTFIWSQMLYPDIEIPKGCKGKHGLDAWGTRFNIPKPKHEDWSQFSEEMLIRNQEDVKINVKLWEKIKRDTK